VTLTAERARELFRYDPETGRIYWRDNGDLACRADPSMYRVVYAAKPRGGTGKPYRAHRLAWLLQTGEWPVALDHINRKRSDNRWCNLRKASPAENARNQLKPKSRPTASRFKGVKQTGKGLWRAFVIAKNARVLIGPFSTEVEAAVAYDQWARKLHGAFACTNEDLGLLPKLSEAA
jgi:hypothetical protein